MNPLPPTKQPVDGRKPVVPVAAAGDRQEPPQSPHTVSTAEREASAAPLPPEEPPTGKRVRQSASHHFSLVQKKRL